MNLLFSYRGIDQLAGGVERMITTLMNEMDSRGHRVQLLTLDRSTAISFFEIKDSIVWHRLDLGDFKKKASLITIMKRMWKSRLILKKFRPDVIIAFQDGAFLSSILYSLFTAIPLILAERVSPQHYNYKKNGRLKRWLLMQACRKANAITVQCRDYQRQYPNFLQHKIFTIPNPVKQTKKRSNTSGVGDEIKRIVCVGRYTYQKNQSVLIKAFKEICRDFPDWHLQLIGEGEDFEVLQESCRGYRQIELIPNQYEIENLLLKAHVFCLPSRWEGFPNALAEALGFGLPAVGFADCGGVSELINNGKNGFLVPGNDNSFALKDAITILMKNDELRVQMGEAAKLSITQYESRTVFDTWERLFINMNKVSR